MTWKQIPANQPYNRRIWEEELASFLPERIFDVHSHILDDATIPGSGTFSCAGHPMRAYGAQELLADYAAALPGKHVQAMCFGFPDPSYDFDRNNNYVATVCDKQKLFPLRLFDPQNDTPELLRKDLAAGRFVGLKPYPDYVRGDLSQATIHQMLPDWGMEIANEFGSIIMLHIPRPQRLADPLNQQQLIDICSRYPRARVILAHIGRAYFLKNAVGNIAPLAHLPNLYVDLAMVNHWEVMEHLFSIFPRDRILYGSDMPIAIAPGKSVEINDQYTYVTPVPWKLSISDDHGKLQFTSFLYEELRAIKHAVERMKLPRSFVEDLFYGNAQRLLARDEAPHSRGSGARSSERWARRLHDVMPWGSSTCSKAARLMPEEPGVIVRGKGCRVWDADGREYIDFRNSLGPVTLGYGFGPVDEAIRCQLEQGIAFGHPHPLECEVAEMIRDAVPSAQKVRFLKTGGEAVAACIRLARHATGRQHVIQIGYNGWLNSLSAGGRVLPGRSAADAPPGVPQCLSELHHACPWNDIESVRLVMERFSGDVAAVVVAADYADIASGKDFYPAVRRLTREQGTLLVLDEIVTGYRIAIGGVQEYFGISPDLSIFAKGIANGMPLSAYAGRADVMDKLKEVVITSTLGGETLSLAAAKAALEFYRTNDVVGYLWRMGERMWKGFNNLAARHKLPIQARGFWPCPQIVFGPGSAEDIPDRFFRAAYRRGVSLYNVSYVNFSHTEADVDEALDRLDQACGDVKK